MKDSLNEEQRRAVTSTNRRILCLAGAGTGKTHSMLSRIEHLIDEGADPRSMLVLTFTNAAAAEMEGRFIRRNQSSRPEFKTFHGFCYTLLCKDADVLRSAGYSSVPSVCDESQEKLIESKIFIQTRIKEPKGLFRSFQDERESAVDKHNKELYRKAFQSELTQRGLITFDSMCYYISKMFSENNQCVEKYKTKYKYVFVDEFQDTDYIQWEFVKSFKESYIFLVGDALQSIYAFRGCTNEIIKQLSVDKEWEVIKLYRNYRSTKQICDNANMFSKGYADDNYRIPISSEKDGVEVEIDTHPENMIAIIKKVADATDDQGTSALLFRTNKEVSEACGVLKSLGKAFYQKEEATDWREAMLSSCSNEHAVTWMSSKLSFDQLADWQRYQLVMDSSKDNATLLSEFLEKFSSTMPSIKRSSESLFYIRSLIKKIGAKKITISDAIQDLESRFKICLNEDSKVNLLSSKDAKEFSWRFAECEVIQESAPLYVGTIHSVKGLEYNTVFVVVPEASNFRTGPSGKEENNNLMYVAITRPKDTLIIYTSKSFQYGRG